MNECANWIIYCHQLPELYCRCELYVRSVYCRKSSPAGNRVQSLLKSEDTLFYTRPRRADRQSSEGAYRSLSEAAMFTEVQAVISRSRSQARH
jgi:hypothetical protein